MTSKEIEFLIRNVAFVNGTISSSFHKFDKKTKIGPITFYEI